MENVDERPDWVDSKLFPFESRWMKTDGHEIHYVDEGPADAPVMLFLHPAFGWSFTFREHIKALRTRSRCVAPDFPGFGLSRAAPGYGFTLIEQAAALGAFVRALDLRRITVWAGDGGGPTAVIALGREPDRVSALVVGGTFAWSLSEYPAVVKFLKIAAGRPFRAFNRTLNFLPRTMGGLSLGTRTLSRAERQHYVRPFRQRATRDRPLRLFGSFTDPRSWEELEKGRAALREKPVLIQFGTRDAMTKQGWPQQWAREFAEHETVMLPGVKHFPFEDAPALTLANFAAWNSAAREAS